MSLFEKPPVTAPIRKLHGEEKSKAVDAVPYTPMLITDGMSPTELRDMVERVRIGGMRVLDAAIQRGRFNFQDIEAITASMTVMLLNPMADPTIFRVSSSLNPHLDRLAKLIKDRDAIEINEEAANRLKQIEAALEELSGGK